MQVMTPGTCQDPFLVADRRIVSANEGRMLQRRRGADLTSVRFRAERNGPSGSAGTPTTRALGRFRTGKEPRSIVQSRTIERGVLGTICGQRRASRRARWSNWRRGRAARRRSCSRRRRPSRDAARFVSLPRRARDGARAPGSPHCALRRGCRLPRGCRTRRSPRKGTLSR